MTSPTSTLPAYTTVPEPELLFDAGHRAKHPLTGLIDAGPYSAGLGILRSLRLAVVCRQHDLPKLKRIVHELCGIATPKFAPAYYRENPSKGVRVVDG